MEGDNGRESNAVEQAHEEVGDVGESNERGGGGNKSGEDESGDDDGEAEERGVDESGRFEPASGGFHKEIQ